jgi:hypothetical protein
MTGGGEIQAQKGAPDGMTATQGLMAPALTERANGKRYEVNANGVSHAKNHKHAPRDTPRLDGMWASGMERMQEMLQGGKYSSAYIPGKHEGGRGKAINDAQGAIAQSLAGGHEASVSAGGHWYRVTGENAGQLTVRDQLTGQVSQVSADQFLSSAEAVTFAGGAGQVSKDARKHSKHEAPGGAGNGVRTSNPVEDLR